MQEGSHCDCFQFVAEQQEQSSRETKITVTIQLGAIWPLLLQLVLQSIQKESLISKGSLKESD